jgi:hypothetical protein
MSSCRLQGNHVICVPCHEQPFSCLANGEIPHALQNMSSSSSILTLSVIVQFQQQLPTAALPCSDLQLASELNQAAEEAAAAAAADGQGDGSSEGAAAAVDWAGLFPPGKVVSASVHELRDYGTVMDLEAHPDVVGLVVPDQGGGPEAAQLQGDDATRPLGFFLLQQTRCNGSMM